jgi:hypothetical protein
MTGRERGGPRCPQVAGGQKAQSASIRTPPLYDGLHAKVDSRRRHGDRKDTLECRPAPAATASQSDRRADAEPQDRTVRRLGEPTDGTVELGSRRPEHSIEHRPVDGPKLAQGPSPARPFTPTGLDRPREHILDGWPASLRRHARILRGACGRKPKQRPDLGCRNLWLRGRYRGSFRSLAMTRERGGSPRIARLKAQGLGDATALGRRKANSRTGAATSGHLALPARIDNAEIIDTVHRRRAPMVSVSASLGL